MLKQSRFLNRSILLIILFSAAPALGQLTFIQSTTVRNGQLPQFSSDTRGTGYSDIVIGYRGSVNAVSVVTDLHVEGFRSETADLNYLHVLRKYLSADWSWGELEVGSIYKMYGQGLLLRGFELPGFLYEDAIYRVQQRVVRDYAGAALTLRRGNLNLNIISGKPTIDPLRPPATRKTQGSLRGLQLELTQLYDLSIGVRYVDYDNESLTQMAGVSIGWSPTQLITIAGELLSGDIQVEFARQISDLTQEIVGPSPTALFASGTAGWGPLGISAEYKDYVAFDLGFNDPPPLVRESAERLLNRSTHVLLASNESGVQIETYFALPYNFLLTTNISRAENNFGGRAKFDYEQNYLGLDWFGQNWAGRLFFETGLEGIFFEQERRTVGIRADRSLASGPTLGYDLQGQTFRRLIKSPIAGNDPLLDQSITNLYFALSVQNWHGLTLGAGIEQSDDPNITDKVIRYPSVTAGWQKNYRFGASLFVGGRRSGTACDHGYCVQVLEFNGMELSIRWQL